MHYLNLWYIVSLYPCLNFLLESLIFLSHKCRVFTNSFIHSINMFLGFALCLALLGVEDIAVSKADMAAASLSFQFSG